MNFLAKIINKIIFKTTPWFTIHVSRLNDLNVNLLQLYCLNETVLLTESVFTGVELVG